MFKQRAALRLVNEIIDLDAKRDNTMGNLGPNDLLLEGSLTVHPYLVVLHLSQDLVYSLSSRSVSVCFCVDQTTSRMRTP